MRIASSGVPMITDSPKKRATSGWRNCSTGGIFRIAASVGKSDAFPIHSPYDESM